jgi:hypothetical protein
VPNGTPLAATRTAAGPDARQDGVGAQLIGQHDGVRDGDLAVQVGVAAADRGQPPPPAGARSQRPSRAPRPAGRLGWSCGSRSRSVI